MQKSSLDSLRISLGWPLLFLFGLLILSSTGAQLHGRLLVLGDWFFEDYYLVRADMPAPQCNPSPNIENRLAVLEQEATESSGLDALFDDEVAFDAQAARRSLEGSRDLCREKHKVYESSKDRITLPIKLFRAVEISVEFFTLLVFDYQRVFIICLLFLGGICATIGQHHIAFRPIRTLRDHRLSHGLELFALIFFFLPSVYQFYMQKQMQAGISGVEGFEGLIFGGVIVMIFATVWRFLSPPIEVIDRPSSENGSWLESFLSIPIYIYMMCISGYYFYAIEGHTTGIAIYTGQLFEQAEMFLKVGLYIWLGMLLKRSTLGYKLFDVLRPWGFSPGIVAFFAVLMMAVPTAYTGASGIIIIAMGAVVYKELIASGARRSLALAATAMTGSSGVVLRPCLIIVIIAALNKDVVTSDLYLWGGRVFLLSAAILLVFLMMTCQQSLKANSWSESKLGFLNALNQLVQPFVIFVAVACAYYFLLDAKLDEISAPIILPVILLLIIWFELKTKKQNNAASQTTDLQVADLHVKNEPMRASFFQLVMSGSQEAALHVGALLMLMAFSFTIGGVIERTEVVMLLPETFQSIWVCMTMLVVLLVLIGMVMDPFGAVVLVSGSIAAVAYTNGIAPLHFWMVTLVAFELGYLSPPVALNHLLTRQVIGEDEARQAQLEASRAPTKWLRHERVLLPVCVMSITLLLTAFVPLMF